MSESCCLKILKPKKNWAFTEYLDEYFNLLDAQNLTPATVSSSLARNFEDSRKENQEAIEDLYCMFRWVCLLVGFQVIAWAIAAL